MKNQELIVKRIELELDNNHQNKMWLLAWDNGAYMTMGLGSLKMDSIKITS